MQLILNPRQFDVILTENMFGDILSDEASVISGSIGLLASASVGEKTALFEPIHGAYSQAKDKNIANPIGAILSAALLLEHFKLFTEAQLIRDAVEKSLFRNICTKDINPESLFKTNDIGEFITDYIQFPEDYITNPRNIQLGQSTII
jgi:3-isopropylmalate dehydrogenase